MLSKNNLGAAVIAAGGSASGIPVFSENRHLSLMPKETALTELARRAGLGVYIVLLRLSSLTTGEQPVNLNCGGVVSGQGW